MRGKRHALSQMTRECRGRAVFAGNRAALGGIGDLRFVRSMLPSAGGDTWLSRAEDATLMTDAVYAAYLTFADWCDRHRSRLLLVGGPVYGLFLVAIGHLVLRRFPNSGDEYVYLYQATTLAAGRLTNPAPVVPAAFEFNYIVQQGPREFGSFPPGWPLALALATFVHVPTWLVNPILAVVTLVVVWALARELHGPRIGALAAAIVAVSPFFIFNGASFFSHTFCGLLLVFAAWCAARADRRAVGGPLLAGASIGWAVLARYFTGAVGGAAVAALLVSRTRPRHVRALALLAAGGLPFVFLLGAYDTVLSGSPWRLTTLETTVSQWFAPGFALRGPDILAGQLLQFVLWTPPALLAVYVWFLGPRARLVDWMFVLVAVLLMFYVNRGGNQYGPRFYYEGFLFLAIYASARLFAHDRLADAPRATRRLFAALAVSVAMLPVLFAVHARRMHTIVEERMDIYDRVADARLSHALVLVGGRVGTARSMAARDLTRNGIERAGGVLYALDRGPAENCALAAAHPGRAIFRYVWDRERRAGQLVPVRCD